MRGEFRYSKVHVLGEEGEHRDGNFVWFPVAVNRGDTRYSEGCTVR